MITPSSTPEAEDPAEAAARKKAEEVVKWRTHRLVKVGYSAEDAELLARGPHVDIHRAEDLLEKGCPPTTALLILL